MQFASQYDSRVIIYKRKFFIRLATGPLILTKFFGLILEIERPSTTTQSFFSDYDLRTAGKSNGQSYKHFTLVNYDSRAVIISKMLIFVTLES